MTKNVAGLLKSSTILCPCLSTVPFCFRVIVVIR